MAKIGSFGAAVKAETNQEPDTFDMCGEEFTIADKVGSMPLMRFAAAAFSGQDTSEMEGLAAMYDMLRDCLADDEQWQRFQYVTTRNRTDGDELLEVCKAVYETVTARPTAKPSDSSDGPSIISPSSNAQSSGHWAEQRGMVAVADLAG